jgi:hypothetical protein
MKQQQKKSESYARNLRDKTGLIMKKTTAYLLTTRHFIRLLSYAWHFNFLQVCSTQIGQN